MNSSPNIENSPPTSQRFPTQKKAKKFERKRKANRHTAVVAPLPGAITAAFRKIQSSKDENENEIITTTTRKRGSAIVPVHPVQEKRAYWNNFEAYETCFDPKKILNKKEEFFSIITQESGDDEEKTKRAIESFQKNARSILKKITKASPYPNPKFSSFIKNSLSKTQSTSFQQQEHTETTKAQEEDSISRVFTKKEDRIMTSEGMTSRSREGLMDGTTERTYSFEGENNKGAKNFKAIEVKDEKDTEDIIPKDTDANGEKIAATTNNSGISSNGSSNEDDNEDKESDDSFVDSLVEDNPFEERGLNVQRSLTLRNLHSKLRDTKKYQGAAGFVLFPDDTFKKFWDFVVIICLLYTGILMPFRLAFIDNPIEWVVMDWIIDGFFFVDICVNFFSAYFDTEDNLITDKRKIIKHYLFGWFIVDISCVFPFHLLDLDNQNGKYNKMVKLARLPRLYRLIKIVKLVRMFKVIKDRKKFQNYMNDILKLGPAYERLFILIVGMLLFCHISGCVWFLLVSLNDSATSWIHLNSLEDLPEIGQYIACLYFVVQTVVTVGYGDMTPFDTEERILASFYMVGGVLFYSVFIGFLSSLVSDIETLSQKFNYKLGILSQIKKEYGLSISFTKQLIGAIKYEHKQKLDSKQFIQDLPIHLGVELSYRMYQEIVSNIPFFQNRSKGFISSIGPLLRPMTISKDEYIFMEGDPADEIFFIKSGKIAYVLPKFNNFKFLKVREGYFFGEVDLLFYGEIRKYTAMAVRDCEFYVLNKKDFKKIFLVDYRDVGSELYDNGYGRKVRAKKIHKEALQICKVYQATPNEQGRRGNSRHKLSLFRAQTPKDNQEDEDSEESDHAKKIEVLSDIAEEDNEEAKKDQGNSVGGSSPPVKGKVGLTALKAALALRQVNPFMQRSSFGEALETQKAKFKEDRRIHDMSEKMEMLEHQMKKVVALSSVLSEKLKRPSDENIRSQKSPKTSFIVPHAMTAGERTRTITIIKNQPRCINCCTPHKELDLDEDFIHQLEAMESNKSIKDNKAKTKTKRRASFEVSTPEI